MSNNIMDKLCEGCLSYERIGECIPTNSLEFYGNCPGYTIKDTKCLCQNCLIKGMCNNVCEDFLKTPWSKAPGLQEEESD